ncbi:MAG: hypothetical protein ACTSQJ_09930 [Promethearchaeota archaeon]
MKLETLKLLLNIEKRKIIYSDILNFLKNLEEISYISYKPFEISEGIIPIIQISKESNKNHVKNVKIFIGAQHNEYNGLFGILKFLKLIQKEKINLSEILREKQLLIFAPLMNPYGFLNPSKNNKSGYYIRNGANLNRFWRRTFVPEYQNFKDDLNQFSLPEHTSVIKNILSKYWNDDTISIYLMDFHETSLLYRFPKELSQNLTPYYKFDHWLKERIIKNIIKLNNIRYFRKPLFYKCSPTSNHKHINLTIKQIDVVFEKLHEHIVNNLEKLAFYFCYSNKSKNYCQKLANIVYNKLKNILWNTKYPAYPHKFHDHGCFVKTSDATSRNNFFAMELESQKQFFNIFEEINNSKINPNYFEKKLKSINLSIRLVIETIKEMIKLS